MAMDTKIETLLESPQAKDSMRNKSAIEPEAAAVTTVCDYTSDLKLFHNVPEPESPKPAPAHIFPIPSRYPETLGTLVEIRESEGKGLGMFAIRDILPGTFILCEGPLLVTTKNDSLLSLVNCLPSEDKKKVMSLSAFDDDDAPLSEEEHLTVIENCNSFQIMDENSGIFETASRINHSCVPNTSYRWRQSIGRMAFWNRFKLLEGEEVTIDYGHSRRVLKSNYGFDCDCGGCSEVEMESDREN